MRCRGAYFVEIVGVFPSAFESHACVQHHQRWLPKVHFYFYTQVFPFFDVADVHGVSFHVSVILENGGAGFGEEGSVVVDECEVHAMFPA